MKLNSLKYGAVVIGTSAGGLDALSEVLPNLRKEFPIPIIVVLHISPSSDSYLTEYLNNMCELLVKEATEKEVLEPGVVYFAPPDYHLLIEEDGSLSLSNCEKINYSRPSIDVLFETASWSFGEKLIGIVMTGANWDGSAGLKTIKENGGFAICENPQTAAVPRMPESAIDLAKPDLVLELNEIGPYLNRLI
ncbi:MAG: chemotaxis protein CheB [Bacteroidales bacterium]|nr:chemotaxis protein CheB [Bacteroidales bacterium]